MDKSKKIEDIAKQVIADDNSYVLVDKHYHPKEVLGHGMFGCVVLMQNKHDIGDQVAAKIVKANQDNELRQVNMEIETGKRVTGLPGMLNIMEGENHIVGQMTVKLVFMELLGPNLADLLAFCNGKFSLKTITMIGIQMVRRLELLHSVGLVHRDIKPENFVMGTGKGCQTVYLIDYGLATTYCSGNDGANHVKARCTGEKCGTPRYMSKTAYNSVQSRRDDMESLSYVLSFLLGCTLPWKGKGLDKWKIVMDLKRNTSSKEILGDDLSQHSHLVSFMDQCRNIGFADKPPYDEMMNLLALCMKTAGMVYDYKFDWLDNV